MKTYRHLLILSMSLFLISCSKDNEEPEVFNHVHLLKAEHLANYTKEQISNTINLVAGSQPEFSHIKDKVKYGVSLYYIEYKTDYINNTKITASAIISVPITNGIPSLLLSFQNGTIVQKSEAPSKSFRSPNMMLMHAIASMGYTVCISDNIGFGASEDKVHPYMNKKLFQKSIVNAINAVKDLESRETTPINLNGELFLAGYSLGGWSTLVAHNYIESNSITGLNLIGSASGAGAYDLLSMRDYLFAQTDYVQPFYLPLMMWGFHSTGDIETDLAIYFKEPYASKIPTLYNGTQSATDINSQLTGNIQQLMTDELITNSQLTKYSKLTQALQENSQKAWNNKKPIHLFHGTDDVHVPYLMSENLMADFIENYNSNELVKFTPLAGADHNSGLMPMFFEVLELLCCE